MKKKKHITERRVCATVNKRDMDMDIGIREQPNSMACSRDFTAF